MSLNLRLRRLLSDEFVWYRLLPYRDAVDAQHVAAAVHEPGRALAKTVMLRDGVGPFVMAVLPASCTLDLEAVRRVLGRADLRLAREIEFAPLFPDCAVGAMPPFGRLYGITLLADACLLDTPQLLFRGGTHHALVRARVEDWISVARPVFGSWCTRQVHAA